MQEKRQYLGIEIDEKYFEIAKKRKIIMAKIDLEKLICSLAERNIFLRDALKEQGLEYKEGEIVEIQKPKFKVGDWVVWQNKCYKVNYNGCGYELIDQNDLSTSLEYGTVDESAHLWTIQDAKDGDVLVNGSNIFIFHFIKATRLMGYCHVNTDDGRFYNDIGKNECFCLIDAVVTPATNAQRDILFQKMKEAVYEWDADKKELKKIEAGKTSFANRQLYNRAILKILSNYVEKYPDIRFGQMLYNLGVNPHFDEESKETYWNLNETINK